MATTTNNRLPVRSSGGSQLPASPAKPGSTLLALAQMALEKSKTAGGRAVSATGRAARAAGRAAKRLAPEKPADIAIEETAAVASHVSAHAVHRRFGSIAVGVKGGLELIALLAAKFTRKSPRVMRAIRSTLRGTLHHSLGSGLHHKWPLTTTTEIKTAGVDSDAEIGDAGVDEDGAAKTEY